MKEASSPRSRESHRSNLKSTTSQPPPNKLLLIINVAFRALHRRGNVSNTEGDDSRGGGGRGGRGGWRKGEGVRQDRGGEVCVWEQEGVSGCVTSAGSQQPRHCLHHPPPSTLVPSFTPPHPLCPPSFTPLSSLCLSSVFTPCPGVVPGLIKNF